MEVIGRLIQTLEERGGTSASGREWKVRSYVIEMNDGASQFPRRMVFDLFGEDRINQYAQLLQVNANVKVYFDIDAREYQGRWFNSIRAYRIDPVDANQPYGAPQAYGAQAAPFAQAAPYAQTAPQGGYSAPQPQAAPMQQMPPISNSQPAQNAAPSDNSSDLPF